jgi:CRP/FNR family transcriptional regulator, anaerobic regulatory protein
MSKAHENLFYQIAKTTNLSEVEKQHFERCFKSIKVEKNTIIEEQGKIPAFLYFIDSGFMRLFYYDNEGDEQTTFLSTPTTFITSFLGFINQMPGTENIECVTDCELLMVSYHDLRKLIDENEKIKDLSLVIFKNALEFSGKRANDLATLQAEQRYKKLIEEQPEIIQNIPIQYIASYLGIKPQSLSRIRKQMIS